MHKTLFWLLTALFSLNATAQNDTFSVYFDFGIAQLDESAMRNIDSLVYHEVLSTGKKIAVIGYADHIGGEASNLKLSEARAEAVKRHLLNSGFKTSDIQIVLGRGELNTGSQAENRKVEIVAGTLQVVKAVAPQTTQDKEPDLSTLKPNETARLNNLNFWGGSYKLLPESKPALEKLKKFLIENPKVKIAIEGHVCCVPIKVQPTTDEDFEAIDLSIARARTVYDYLVLSGVSKDRLSYKGFGGSKPLVTRTWTEADATKNRRVEIRILEK